MSVLVFADASEGKYKKSAFEVVSYGKKVAEQLGTAFTVVTINASEVSELYTYGAEKVLTVSNDQLRTFNAKGYTSVIQQAAAAAKTQALLCWIQVSMSCTLHPCWP